MLVQSVFGNLLLGPGGWARIRTYNNSRALSSSIWCSHIKMQEEPSENLRITSAQTGDAINVGTALPLLPHRLLLLPHELPAAVTLPVQVSTLASLYGLTMHLVISALQELNRNFKLQSGIRCPSMRCGTQEHTKAAAASQASCPRFPCATP